MEINKDLARFPAGHCQMSAEEVTTQAQARQTCSCLGALFLSCMYTICRPVLSIRLLGEYW